MFSDKLASLDTAADTSAVAATYDTDQIRKFPQNIICFNIIFMIIIIIVIIQIYI